jgi:hypothetical protein
MISLNIQGFGVTRTFSLSYSLHWESNAPGIYGIYGINAGIGDPSTDSYNHG